MSIPDAYDLRAENIGIIDLVELDTTEGVFRFLLGDDGWFVDVNGNKWIGSRLISCSELEFSINGSAPGVEIGLTFIQDPDEPDVIGQMRDLGSRIVKGRPARFYMQYLETTNEFFRPVYAPQLLTKRTMMNLGFSFDGPQVRRVSLQVEGPFDLRAKPVGGRYNTADHSRRLGLPPGVVNPSLEFMPIHGIDEQSLFGL